MSNDPQRALKVALLALYKCKDGFEFTRQYVGYETLPMIEGWTHFDADCVASEAINTICKELDIKPNYYVGCSDNKEFQNNLSFLLGMKPMKNLTQP